MVSRRGVQILGFLSALAAVVAMGVAPAEAIPIIQFDQAGSQMVQDGTVSWAGGDAPLIGDDIGFSVIRGLGDLAGMGLQCDPLVSGPGQPCMLLDFETGPFAGESAGTLSWDGGVGSSFVVTLTDGDALDAAAGEDLGLSDGEAILTGTAMFSAEMPPGGLVFRNISITGLDTKHDAIVDFFFPGGAPEEFNYSNTDITLLGSASIDLEEGFATEVSDADINNTIPLPATSLLMLLGLGGLALRKRFM